jgi:hypothetical protein
MKRPPKHARLRKRWRSSPQGQKQSRWREYRNWTATLLRRELAK